MGLAESLRETYQRAAKEVDKKTRDFLARHKAKAERMLKQVEAGKISMDDYKDWLQGQVFIGERWKEKLDDITRTYVEADEKAREIVNKTDKNVFVKFANAQGKDIKSHVAGYSFDLYDKHTVERLLKEDPKMLPAWKINQKKDYTWNEKRVKNEIMQGIIQGEDIPKIAKRLSSGLATDNNKKMNMFARTAVTGAQNAGRMQMLHDAQEKGIVVKKKWLATIDKRTRDVHRDELNGVEVDVDEPFHTSLGDIMFPGDPNADPANTYNCRCTLIYVYDVKASRENLKEKEQEEQTSNFAKQVSFTEVFSEEQQSAVRTTLSMASRQYPLPYELDFVGDGRIPRNLPHETIWDLRENYPERRIDYGEEAQYLSIKKTDGSIERRIDIIKDNADVIPLDEMFETAYKSHKRFEESKSLEDALYNAGFGLQGTVLHEYGHAVQDYCGFFIRDTAEGAEFEKWIREFSRNHPTEILSISRYAGESLVKGGGINPSEVWAEAFVTSFDTHHDTMAWQAADKILQEFKRRFGHKFRKK